MTTSGIIVVKSEPTFNVKVENNEEQFEICQEIAVNSLDKMQLEKTKLVQDLLCLREDYDRVCAALNSKEAECSELKMNLMTVEQKVENQNKQIRHLQQINQKKYAVEKNSKKMYNVDEIVSHKKVNGELFFLIQWEDFGAKDRTWEPRKNLLSKKILNDYMNKNNLI